MAGMAVGAMAVAAVAAAMEGGDPMVAEAVGVAAGADHARREEVADANSLKLAAKLSLRIIRA